MGYTLANSMGQSTKLPQMCETFCIGTNFLVVFATKDAQNRREKGKFYCGISAAIEADFPNVVVNFAKIVGNLCSTIPAIFTNNVAIFTSLLVQLMSLFNADCRHFAKYFARVKNNHHSNGNICHSC